MITLRKATSEEFEEVKTIYSSPHARKFVYGRTDDEIKELLQNRFMENRSEGLSGVYVLERANQLVATVNLVRDLYQCDHVLYIGGLVVRQECLGQKLGREVMAKIDELAVRSGIKKLQLEVEADNPKAIKLYQDAGYRQEGVKEIYVQREDGFVDEILMGKKI